MQEVNINISGHNVEVTPALEQYVHKKIINKLSKRFKLIQVKVILTVEKLIQKAEASIDLPGGRNPLFAAVSSEDMYSSIDQLSDKLCKQLEKFKGHLSD